MSVAESTFFLMVIYTQLTLENIFSLLYAVASISHGEILTMSRIQQKGNNASSSSLCVVYSVRILNGIYKAKYSLNSHLF